MWKPKTSLLLVETVFLANEKQFFFHLSDIPGCETYSGGNVFFNEFFILASGTVFLSSGNSILLFRALLKFLTFGGNNFF